MISRKLRSLAVTATVATAASSIHRHAHAQPRKPNAIFHTYDANDPSEDRSVTNAIIAGWSASAVFDGHGGYSVAQFVSSTIMTTISKYLEEMKGSDKDNEAFDQAIVKAFNEVELQYLDSIRNVYSLGFGSVAKVGSCCLVLLTKGDQLAVANAGDCRAVLGSKLPMIPNRWYATSLTSEHNARIPIEVLTLQREHPGETDIVRCKNPHACYVKGRLQLTRSFGDAYLKYNEFNIDGKNGGRYIPAPFTPPYVKHQPDITHIKLDPADKFVILATDGLWDFVSDQEAVNIVAGLTDPSAAAEALVELALDKAAKECGMTKAELKSLPRGRHRRSRHDDTTVVVVYI